MRREVSVLMVFGFLRLDSFSCFEGVQGDGSLVDNSPRSDKRKNPSRWYGAPPLLDRNINTWLHADSENRMVRTSCAR